MPTGGVSGYAAINARVRVMYSTLFTPAQLTSLTETADLNGLLAFLKNTAYGPYLDRVKDKELTPRRAVFQLKGRLADENSTIIHNVPETTRPLISQFYRINEIDNLKAILRGIITGASWNQIRFVLFPLGSMTVLPGQAMAEAGSVAAALELLRGTVYYDTLSFAMKRFTAEQNLFPLEVALDLFYWRKLWEEVKQLSGDDRVQAMRIIGPLVDFNNLMWVIRYRVYHQLSEEELINYTLPFGYHVSDESIRAIAAGADMPSIVSQNYPGLSNVEELFVEPRRGLPKLEIELKRDVAEKCRAVFLGNPFHVGIPLAFLVLADFEIQDLTMLIEAKSTQAEIKDFRPLLLMG
ncbi:MAG TPA: V-type ATPase subunit [Anaerolineaceae bacterium]|nr:V-type ATPase subunit [Anaerolineaceae bacterium]